MKVRYYQDSTPVDVPCREENFERREIEMGLPIDQTALVLVDLWQDHFIESWIERAAQVLREKVLPVINAARSGGISVIHGPCPEVAGHYEQLDRHKAPEPSGETPAWPPPAWPLRLTERGRGVIELPVSVRSRRRPGGPAPNRKRESGSFSAPAI